MMESLQLSAPPSSDSAFQVSTGSASPEVAEVEQLDTSDSMSSDSAASAYPMLPSATAVASTSKDQNELPFLEDKQEEVMTSQLLKPIKITFSEKEEKEREENRLKIVPAYFHRTSYETSITLSEYTSKDTHAKHREQPELRITKGNAFQAVCPFTLDKDLNRERIERHLIWNKKRDPSSYISAFNGLSHAIRRAGFHYKDSQRIGHRVFIAQISTEGFVAATVRARCKTTVNIVTKRKFHADSVESSDYFFDVDIPVWIRDPRRPADRADLTVEELTELGTDMWISITEIRNSNLKNGPKSRVKYSRDCICSKGHSYEWLACGVIPKSCIVRVMPYDGKVLYRSRTTRIIRSLDSTEPWVWSWEKKMWVLDSALTAIAEWRDMEAHEAREARKRITEEDEDIGIDQEKPAKRSRLIEFTIVRPYINFSTGRQNTTSGL